MIKIKTDQTVVNDRLTRIRQTAKVSRQSVVVQRQTIEVVDTRSIPDNIKTKTGVYLLSSDKEQNCFSLFTFLLYPCRPKYTNLNILTSIIILRQ